MNDTKSSSSSPCTGKCRNFLALINVLCPAEHKGDGSKNRTGSVSKHQSNSYAVSLVVLGEFTSLTTKI